MKKELNQICIGKQKLHVNIPMFHFDITDKVHDMQNTRKPNSQGYVQPKVHDFVLHDKAPRIHGKMQQSPDVKLNGLQSVNEHLIQESWQGNMGVLKALVNNGMDGPADVDLGLMRAVGKSLTDVELGLRCRLAQNGLGVRLAFCCPLVWTVSNHGQCRNGSPVLVQ
ncbi:hypothetical protein VNO78_09385 [Psophocarpus tetragonolobus]|uniref:Uncharacterized protein n=1 Tax=Psophocarpus tetragonolobus TaxID=3891 RepID=A0AAN9T6J6_PSOTE